jgi:preprotein translocase subunit YajC
VLISNAYAQTAGGLGGLDSQLTGMLPIILMFVVLYFLMIRPQMKRAKDQREMTAALSKGDEVITSGGIVGRITKVGDAYLTLEVGQPGDRTVEMAVQKAAVTTLLPKGTIKSIA